MTDHQIPLRSEIPLEHTWNDTSVFETPAAWEAELKAVAAVVEQAIQFRGRLHEGPLVLAELVELAEDIEVRLRRTGIYAGISYYVDTSDPDRGGRMGMFQSIAGQASAALAFVDPELLQIGQETLSGWVESEPRLAHYAQYIHDLFRKQAHVRSAEVEEILGLLADPFASTHLTASTLINSDLTFKPAQSASGDELAVNEAALEKILAGPDREARRSAWESYTDTFLAFKNTLAANLSTSIKQNIFQMRARRHTSSLEATLFQYNIPVEVFHNLIETFRKNLPTWHRYWAIRRRALGVETLQPYDIWAPLTASSPTVSYEQAVEWVMAGLAPLGEDYVEIVRRGCLEQRWVDIYPTKGKVSGAFSWGAPGTHPFIVMNYDDTLFSLSTLAHELGHSMHSYLTWKNQPVIYANYSLFVAEVASNFHQALVRANLLETNPDRDFQIAVIEEAMANFHRYFFIMPSLARFEYETHQRAERGEPLTADSMNNLMADLFEEAYGGQMHVDRPRVGITWATFNHLYTDYYVYQYATGISGANALAGRVLAGQPNAVENYRKFLSAGSSVYPLEALKIAGVDLTRPEPVEEGFQILAGLVDRLEKLVG